MSSVALVSTKAVKERAGYLDEHSVLVGWKSAAIRGAAERRRYGGRRRDFLGQGAAAAEQGAVPSEGLANTQWRRPPFRREAATREERQAERCPSPAHAAGGSAAHPGGVEL